MAEAGSTWLDLQNWVIQRCDQRTDIQQQVVDCLTEAIETYQTKPFLQQEAQNNSWATCQINVQTVALPPDFEGPMSSLFVNIDGVWYLMQQKDQQFIENYNVQVPPVLGPPLFYSIYSSDMGTGAYTPLINLAPVPDQQYQLNAIYIQKVPVPASDVTSNFWTVEASYMIGYAALKLLYGGVIHEDTSLQLAAMYNRLEQKEYWKLQQRVVDVESSRKVLPRYL